MRAVSFSACVRDDNLTLAKNRFSRRAAGAQRIVIDRDDYRRVVSDPDARGDVAPSDSSKPIWGVLGTGWTSYRARKNLAGGGGKHRSAVPRQSGRSADSLAANHTKLIGPHHVVDAHRAAHVSRGGSPRDTTANRQVRVFRQARWIRPAPSASVGRGCGRRRLRLHPRLQRLQGGVPSRFRTLRRWSTSPIRPNL